MDSPRGARAVKLPSEGALESTARPVGKEWGEILHKEPERYNRVLKHIDSMVEGDLQAQGNPKVN